MKIDNFLNRFILAEFGRKGKVWLEWWLFAECRDDALHVITGSLAGEAHDLVFYSKGIADLAEDEMIFFRSSLDVDVPEVEHGWDESVDRGCDVLDAGKSQFTDMTVKETFLFNVNDAFVGNDPDIEIVVNPDEKSEEPQE